MLRSHAFFLAIVVSTFAVLPSSALAQDDGSLQRMVTAMAAASSFHVDVDVHGMPGYTAIDVVRPDDYRSVSGANVLLHLGQVDYADMPGFPSWFKPTANQEQDLHLDLPAIDLEALRYPERLASDAISVRELEPADVDGEHLHKIGILRPSHQPTISGSIVWTLWIGDDDRIRLIDCQGTFANSQYEYRYSRYGDVEPFEAPM